MAKARDGWIDVTDRLPDDDITVLVHAPEASEPVWPAFYDAEQGGWVWIDGSYVAVEVKAWMEFPAPPTKATS